MACLKRMADALSALGYHGSALVRGAGEANLALSARAGSVIGSLVPSVGAFLLLVQAPGGWSRLERPRGGWVASRPPPPYGHIWGPTYSPSSISENFLYFSRLQYIPKAVENSMKVEAGVLRHVNGEVL